MVMGNGFTEGATLMFDHIHRRSTKSEAIRTYSEVVLSTHEAFTHQIVPSSIARVEVIYGQHVQKQILKTMRCSLLPLWSPYSEVFLVLLYESNFSNADKENTRIQSPSANEEGTMFIDKEPRWTLGRSRPLYIVRVSLCHNCPGGGRLIPVHQAVPFIYSS
jgi:hypothetical protein